MSRPCKHSTGNLAVVLLKYSGSQISTWQVKVLCTSASRRKEHWRKQQCQEGGSQPGLPGRTFEASELGTDILTVCKSDEQVGRWRGGVCRLGRVGWSTAWPRRQGFRVQGSDCREVRGKSKSTRQGQGFDNIGPVPYFPYRTLFGFL